MKYIILSIVALFFMTGASAQKSTPLPHGMVFGSKPSTIGLMPASKLEDFMGKRTRTSAAISGVILDVTKTKGGWFTLDAGRGRTIAAHFKNYSVVLPKAIKGREVIISGVATKQFTADDQQQLAGSKEHAVKINPKQRLAFEVVGLMVNK
ncbi:DUF4920 domain-containing protein [Mucilaginibacter galii]|uniref:DUF4920 domain-containing protein n=1 Tax=Mucilaginibacter galii TaxID=2005073 RepID=A0A917N4Z6_9SPHI|nr:DUF4920 domain-containing protein [Mucilaginibacter galii]GGI52597.1 hypothetical protein GCM10011425_38090 [Mucilaginibacter galii]